MSFITVIVMSFARLMQSGDPGTSWRFGSRLWECDEGLRSNAVQPVTGILGKYELQIGQAIGLAPRRSIKCTSIEGGGGKSCGIVPSRMSAAGQCSAKRGGDDTGQKSARDGDNEGNLRREIGECKSREVLICEKMGSKSNVGLQREECEGL